MLTKQELIDFEEDIADCFNKGLIKSPVHLYSGNEDAMIEVWKTMGIQKDDWVLCSWRSHLQCLLKGVPKEQVKKDILDNKSISLCYPEYRILSSGIVGGTLPIAVGLALGIKKAETHNKVVVFIGDMTACTGNAWEAIMYSRAEYQNLPIHFVIEDNNKSVCTDTRKTWGLNSSVKQLPYSWMIDDYWAMDNIHVYHYRSKWPHAGAGKRVQF